jgi:hypothetical protein
VSSGDPTAKLLEDFNGGVICCVNEEFDRIDCVSVGDCEIIFLLRTDGMFGLILVVDEPGATSQCRISTVHSRRVIIDAPYESGLIGLTLEY